MGYDQTTLETQLTLIQTAISTALANPRPDWSVGQVKMSQGGYLKMLFEQQDSIIKQLKEIPAEVVNTANDRVTAFGEDMTEYHNEDSF
jgi:hypothetical protein